MLKINASYGLKEGRANYGSESALCSVEMEVSDSISAEELKRKIHSAFCIVREQCKAELSANGNGEHPGLGDPGSNTVDLPPTRGNGKASNKQIKFITDLANRQGIGLSEMNARIRERFGIDSLYDLDKKQASAVLDGLKGAEKKAA